MRIICALTLLACWPFISSCQSTGSSHHAFSESKDTDGDTINDAFDLCPNSNPTQYILPNGCPLRSLHHFFRDPISFRLLEPEIDTAIVRTLNSDLEFLRENDRVHVVISGYNKSCETDRIGESAALKKAKVVWRYYVNNGLAPERILWVKGIPSRKFKVLDKVVCDSDQFETVQVQYSPW